jgi:hypothetical protein
VLSLFISFGEQQEVAWLAGQIKTTNKEIHRSGRFNGIAKLLTENLKNNNNQQHIKLPFSIIE